MIAGLRKCCSPNEEERRLCPSLPPSLSLLGGSQWQPYAWNVLFVWSVVALWSLRGWGTEITSMPPSLSPLPFFHLPLFFFRFVRLFSGLMWTWRIGGKKKLHATPCSGVSESAGFQSFSSLLGESDAVDRMCVAALHDIDFLLSPTSTHVKSLYNNSHETSDKNSILIFFLQYSAE